MPKLIFVVACEKTVVDINGPVSLIGLFQKMNIRLQEAPLPEKAVAPSQWSIFCLWENDPKEAGQVFTQVLKVTSPDGEPWFEHELTFRNDNPDEYQSKINVQMSGLPIWSEGFMNTTVALKGSEEVLGSYRFAIAYLPKEENAGQD